MLPQLEDRDGGERLAGGVPEHDVVGAQWPARTTLTDGDVEVAGHAAAGDRVVAAVATPDSYGELVLVEDGADRTLTAFGARAAASGITTPRELEVHGRDGYPVHGWVAVPEGEGPFPVILQIHGGPYASYGVHLFDETQVLVDADDPAFADPSKPIGTFMDEATARERAAAFGWVVVEDAGRGYRRVVPSPNPREILEVEAQLAHLVGEDLFDPEDR